MCSLILSHVYLPLSTTWIDLVQRGGGGIFMYVWGHGYSLEVLHHLHPIMYEIKHTKLTHVYCIVPK